MLELRRKFHAELSGISKDDDKKIDALVKEKVQAVVHEKKFVNKADENKIDVPLMFKQGGARIVYAKCDEDLMGEVSPT